MASRDQEQMSYQHHRHEHIDATTGREVVLCHACSNEWYRDEHGLECPSCHSEIVEIIELDNDPRELHHTSSAATWPEISPLRCREDDDEGEDSDPEEADIQEHLGPHGLAFRRSVRNRPDQRHHNPAIDPVIQRFIDMIQGFGAPRTATGGLFAPSPGDQEQNFGPRIQRTTFTARTFSGGTTSVTIVSGPLPARRTGDSRGSQRGDPFQATRDLGPPVEADHDDNDMGIGPPPGFARSLHDILSILSPAGAMAGDAVYSQEALDRIITNIMEANLQSNAAPPATKEALLNLERKTVDKAMLSTNGEKECSICIDEMKEGEMALFLPCKHWFHEECVVLWLKEHNTCPICRTPIEENEGRTKSNNNSRGGDISRSGTAPGRGPSFPSPPPPGIERQGWFSNSAGSYGESSQGESGQQSRPWRASRTPSQSQNRLNGGLRNVSREQDRDRDRVEIEPRRPDLVMTLRGNSDAARTLKVPGSVRGCDRQVHLRAADVQGHTGINDGRVVQDP